MSHLYVQLDPDYPEIWELEPVKRLLRDGALGVIPTDTSYAFVCDVRNKDAVERLYRIKELDPKKPLSVLCRDIPMIAEYTRGLDTSSYRAMKRCLPGPFTFILKAGGEVPRTALRGRKTLGVRVPDDPICAALLEEHGPLLTSSVRTGEHTYWNTPVEISETFDKRLDFVVDGGERLAEPSTVIDLTGREPEIIRHGKGDPELFT